MTKPSLTLLLATFFFLFSCKKDESKLGTIKVNAKEAVELDLKELFDELSYVYLSPSGNKGLISEIDKLVFDGEDFFVFQDEAYAPSIFKFDKKGQLVFHEKSVQEGPGKFIGANDMVLNNEEGTIEILDAYQSKVVSCSKKDGSFVKEMKIPVNFRQFVWFKPDGYAFYAANEPTEWGNFNIYIQRLEDSGLKPFVPINTHLMNTIFENKCFSTSPANGTYLFKEEYSNLVWRVSSTSATIAYEMDFGADWFDENILLGLAGADTEGKMAIINSTNDKVKSLRNVEEFEHNIFFDYFLSRRLYYNFYNKQTKSLTSFYMDRSSINKPNNFDEGPMPYILRGTYKEYVIFETKSDLVYQLGQTAPNDGKFKQFAQTVPEEGNPVLILAKLKEKYR